MGAVLGRVIPSLVNTLTHSLYSRTNLEKIMDEELGDSYFSDALTDEVLVVAYDYNS